MSQQHFKSAKRLQGFENKRVQDIFTPLANETKSINLGQGFPNWAPPSFFQDAISKYVQESSHQYTRAYGHQKLINAIANFYSPLFNREINPLTNVLVSNGGIACLCNAFLGMVDPGDEVILIEPSFDCYRAQIMMSGGIVRSVPLEPKGKVSKNDLVRRGLDGLKYSQQDEWDIDWDLLERSFNENTKAILLNSPHNPTGKIFTYQELERFAEIIKKYDRVAVIWDGVYEAHAYDKYEPLQIPRIANIPGMWERTISVSSAGKLFSATGVRIGWAIGPEHLIKCTAAFHQYNGFCIYVPLQEAIADTLEQSLKGDYFQEFNKKLKEGRTRLVKELISSPINFNIYIPEGGCSVLADISNIEVPQAYYTNPESNRPYTKDWAFCLWLCKEKGVVALPCSAFYSKQYAHIGQNLVRIAFCKTEETLIEAGKRMGSILHKTNTNQLHNTQTKIENKIQHHNKQKDQQEHIQEKIISA
ncbi:hypothetical protein ABPG72_004790 [Tetrahymena utriculariae]